MNRVIIINLFLLLSVTLFSQSYTEQGYAVFYADYFEGRPTASGEIFSNQFFTCAHAQHPFGTVLKVTRTDTGKSVTVRVNDRGGFGKDIIVDLTKAAAAQLDFISAGKAPVVVEVVGYSAEPPAGQTAKGGAKSGIPEEYNFSGGSSSGTVTYLPAAQKGIFLQLASYTIKSNAEGQYLSWKQKGIAYLYLQVTGSGDQKKYIILMGPFSTRPTAEEQLKNLKAKYFMDGFIRELQ